MDILSIFAGLAAIPKLIDRLDQLIAYEKKVSDQKWMQLSAKIEQKISEAETPEEFKEIAGEVKKLISDS